MDRRFIITSEQDGESSYTSEGSLQAALTFTALQRKQAPPMITIDDDDGVIIDLPRHNTARPTRPKIIGRVVRGS